MRVAFVVGVFPAASETFIIDQAADLIDRGVEVEIFAFKKGPLENISPRYEQYRLADRTRFLAMPENRVIRAIAAIPIFVRLLGRPEIWRRALDMRTYGADARSLKLLFWAAPFVGRDVDIYHCHFGPIGNRFLKIRDIAGIKKPFMTSFYGQDASMIFKRHRDPYPRLKRECPKFFVMSENMKQRLVAHGFDAAAVLVHPVGIRPGDYPFRERHDHAGPVEAVSVGRLTEKKGFDDLLEALAVVRERSSRPIRCTIIGDGPLREALEQKRKELRLQDVVSLAGGKPINEIIEQFNVADMYIQPSKTAPDGDME